MVKVCKNCGNKFEAVRDTATYCSAKCRKQAQRLAGQKEVLAGQDDTLKVSGTITNKKEPATPNIPNTEQVATYCSAFKPFTGEQVEWSGETIQHDPRLKHSDIPDGYCKGCGERQSNKDCDVCYKCIAKGLTREKLGLKSTAR